MTTNLDLFRDKVIQAVIGHYVEIADQKIVQSIINDFCEQIDDIQDERDAEIADEEGEEELLPIDRI